MDVPGLNRRKLRFERTTGASQRRDQHMQAMPAGRSAPLWRQLSASGPRRRSASAGFALLNPLKRRRSRWRYLSRPEVRLLMSGLADWEQRSRGPVKTRIRRKRRNAVMYYRKTYGALPDDRPWTAVKLGRAAPRVGRPAHDPRRENERGVLWHEA